MRKDGISPKDPKHKEYDAWICVAIESETKKIFCIKTAGCQCPAGNIGVCTHVAALCYAIVAQTSCTSGVQAWGSYRRANALGEEVDLYGWKPLKDYVTAKPECVKRKKKAPAFEAGELSVAKGRTIELCVLLLSPSVEPADATPLMQARARSPRKPPRETCRAVTGPSQLSRTTTATQPSCVVLQGTTNACAGSCPILGTRQRQRRMFLPSRMGTRMLFAK